MFGHVVSEIFQQSDFFHQLVRERSQGVVGFGDVFVDVFDLFVVVVQQQPRAIVEEHPVAVVTKLIPCGNPKVAAVLEVNEKVSVGRSV